MPDTQQGFTSTVTITVTAGTASQFVFSGLPSTTTAGFTQGLTLTARDASGNVATGYAGTVHFTSSDLQAAMATERISLRDGPNAPYEQTDLVGGEENHAFRAQYRVKFVPHPRVFGPASFRPFSFLKT